MTKYVLGHDPNAPRLDSLVWTFKEEWERADESYAGDEPPGCRTEIALRAVLRELGIEVIE